MAKYYVGTVANLNVDVILQYLIPWARIGTGNPVGQDTKLAGDLWAWFEEQVENV